MEEASLRGEVSTEICSDPAESKLVMLQNHHQVTNPFTCFVKLISQSDFSNGFLRFKKKLISIR